MSVSDLPRGGYNRIRLACIQYARVRQSARPVPRRMCQERHLRHH